MGFQCDYVKNEAGGIGVDKIFTFDKLDDFIAYMGAKIGVSLNLKTLNTSPKKRYESNTAAFVELVLNKLRRELNIRPSTAAAAELNYGLSDGLLSELNDFVAEDRRLYELAKQANPLQAVAAL